MKRHRLAAFGASLLMVSVGAVAHAAPHFQSGSPRITQSGGQVCVFADVAGLGNTPLDIRIEMDATATTECTNPAGNVAPGQDASATGSDSARCIPDKNGRANCTVCAEVTADDFDLRGLCPNRKWSASVTSISLGAVNVNISAGGTQLFP